MKSRTVIILWAVAIALGISIALVKRSQNNGDAKATNRTAGMKLLEKFPADQISTMDISGSNQSVSLTEKDGKWTVAERDGYPANTRNINDLLRTLSDLKVTQGIEAGPSFAPRFGMDENSSDPAERGLTAVFKDPSGKELAKLSFGKNLDSAASSSPYGGGSTGRFVRNHADESGFYAVSEVFGTLSPDPKSWLNDEFFKIEKIESLSVSKPGSDENEWSLVRENEEAEFKFTDAFPGVKIDPTATAPLKSLFSYARFDDVVPAADVEKRSTPEQLRKVVIKTFEGFEYNITIQPAKTVSEEGDATQPPADNFLMTVSVSAELPKERKKPEGEKEEDAKIADEAFTERHKTLTESLEKSKALAERTFEVSKFTVDALLKTRTDLMLKTPAPDATPPPAPGAFQIPGLPTPAE